MMYAGITESNRGILPPPPPPQKKKNNNPTQEKILMSMYHTLNFK